MLKHGFTKISLIALTILVLTSCNTIKRVKEDQHLLTKNTVYVNDKKNNSEIINNLIYQRPNGKLLGYPLRLHIYNLARPNIDSVLNAKYRNPENPKTSLKKWLSVKQFEAYVQSKKKHQFLVKKYR